MSKTKICECVGCGTAVEVSKFMSAAKAKCEACKGEASPTPVVPNEEIGQVEEFIETVDPVEQQQNGGRMTPETILRPFKNSTRKPPVEGVPNKALRSMCCPHHPSQPMIIIGLVRSEMWGDVIGYQCPTCYTTVQISEQTKFPARVRYSYSGSGMEHDTQVEDILNALEQGEGKIEELLKEEEILKWVK